MRITKNTPKPVVQPPPTVDLTGLLPEQIDLIFMLLGNVRRADLIKAGMDPKLAYNMWSHMAAEVYHIKSDAGVKRVSHLNAVGDAFDSRNPNVHTITTYRKEN